MPTTEAADPARPTEAAPLRETRNARRVSPPGGNRPEHCWAFLVGISEYKFAGPSLRKLNFAALDAAGVADVLKRPSCGDVSAERMKLLRDGEATRDRVVGDLREFLRGPAAGDLVILYFACHGMPDPDPQRSHLVYLVAHDTDVTQIGRTGILMREILDSVSDFLASPQRVILICDTCYSGALLQPRTGTRGVDDETERAATVSRFFEQVGASRPGTSVLASAGARQEAYEGKEWDGHGLFTYYLLKGLSGEADTRPTDGRVTIDKLFSYVKEKVAEETKNVQRPVGEAADPDLLIAYVAGLAANDQLEIGRQILQMGLLLDDKGRYRAAAGELEAALQFAADLGSSLPEAGQLLGRAKLMAGDAAGAVRLLADAAARDREGRLPALQYELGLAQVMTGDGASAAETLRGFAARFPGDEHAQWAETLAGWQERAPMARRRALLVGVQTYEHPPGPLPDGSRLMELMGPVKDVRLMQATLIEVCGFAPEDIRVFTDGAATHESVLAELRDLTEEAGPADTILVYLSGNGAVRPQDDYALALFDAVQPPLGLVKSLTALELHQALEPIKTTNKLLIVDACTNDLLLRQLMQATTYAALLGARPGDRALDTAFDAQGEKVNSGLFTYALVQRLRRDGPHVPRRRLLEGIIADIWSREPQQTPILVGASNLPFLPQDPSASMQRLIEFSFRRHYGPFAAADIAALYDASLIDLEAVPFPELHLSAGRAYLGVGEHRRSLEALERARVETNSPCAELLAPLAAARVQAGRFDGGKAAWDSLAQAVGTLEDKARDLEAVLRRLRTPSRRALVVGIEGYAGPAMEGVRTQGAAADADDVRGLLASEGGFEVLVLPPEKATRAVLMDEFEKLCLAARTGPAVFYFAGAGSHEDGMPTLVSVDGRTEGVFDIRLDDLARIAGSDLPNLVVVLDTCFDPEAQPAFRAVARDLRPRPQRRDIGVPEPVKLTVPSVGAATLFHREGIVSVIGNPDSRAAIEAALALRFPQHVVSAQSLAQRLKSSDVAQAGAAGGASRFIAELACDRTGQKQIEAMLQREERRPIANAATLLGRLIEKRKNQDPDGLVSRAVAYSLTGELDAALRDLESAFSQYGADARATEAHYHFGRILIEQGLNPERAVSELEQVVKYDPDHAGARYCLGLAIRQMIERKYNELIREHWQRYLDLGAPLGHADEVTAYLRPPPPPQPLSR